jgi:serine/threonine-protein phosphatase 2B catalytic subunit
MDIFTWSLPFVAEKVVEMLLHVLKQGNDLPDEELKDLDYQKILMTEEERAKNKAKKAESIRKKVKAMSRMMKMFKTLREESENVVQLKGICSDGKVPIGLLLEGKEALQNELIDRSGLF